MTTEFWSKIEKDNKTVGIEVKGYYLRSLRSSICTTCSENSMGLTNRRSAGTFGGAKKLEGDMTTSMQTKASALLNASTTTPYEKPN